MINPKKAKARRKKKIGLNDRMGAPPETHPDAERNALIDIDQLNPVLESLSRAMGVSSVIVDVNGNVLTRALRRRICTDFQQINPQACEGCFESDPALAGDLEEGRPCAIYTCKNGLTDAVSPVVIEGEHLVNVFVGRFFSSEPDREQYRQRALALGLDVESCLSAVDEVPVMGPERLPFILEFLFGLTRLVAFLILERKKMTEAGDACALSVEAAEQAKKELTDYKAHLETLVADRTEELHHSEAYSRLILESVAEGIFGTDLEGRCTFANNAALKMLGYSLEEVMGNPIHELFHHSNADGTPHLLKNCPIHLAYAQGITSFRRDEVFWRKDGTFFDVSYTSVPQRKGEEIVGSVVVFRDIAARKKAEDAMKESEYRLKTILTTANEGFWWVNNEARTLSVNSAFCSLVGRPREEIIGRSVFDFLDEENAAIMKEQLRRRSGGETGVYEIALNRPDGSKVACLFHATPLYDKNAVKTGSFAMISDISHRKKMEQELIVARNKAEAATRAKSDFLANMSHEIRTPMNAVLGMTHLALKTDLTEKQRDYIRKIQISANSLLGVINDILDFSKIEAGKLGMESIAFNLDEVLDNLATQITIKAQEKEGLEVLFSTDADVPRSLVGDPLRLGQVLVNLANNAVKFTERGEIVVSTQLAGLKDGKVVLQFSVRDTGIGLTEEHKARLFTAFTQADASITRKYGGTGLGLTICKRLVDMMGGKIWVESEHGVGSTFFFTAGFSTGRDAGSSRHVLPPPMKGMRVLVVDDNPTSQEIFQTMLSSFTFDVTLAATGEEALARIDDSIGKRPYDIVVMDWKLPGMDGIEASRRIKRHPGLTRVPPIVLVSAYGREEIMWRAEQAGLEAFLIKPVSPSVMFDTLMNILTGDGAGQERPGDKKEKAPDALKVLKGARVLLVEDNEINQQVAMEMLAAAGVKVRLAANGQEAVGAVQAEPFDAVLMDIQMPVMDGYSATRAIREDSRLRDLPIIAMTAHAMSGDQEKSLAAGMNDHINKPIDPDELYTRLAQWVAKACELAGENVPRGEQAPAEKTPLAAPPEGGSLPDALAEFDLPAGLKRLQGNASLYRKLLSQFGTRYTQKAEEIGKALAAGDYPGAHQLVHDIKGLAGNLAAVALQAAAADLEKLVKNADGKSPPPADALAGAFGVFKERMAAALEAVRDLVEAPMAPPSAPSAHGSGQVPPELAGETAGRLKEAAQMGDVSGVMAAARDALGRSEAFRPFFEKIDRLVGDFDFDGVTAVAEELERLAG